MNERVGDDDDEDEDERGTEEEREMGVVSRELELCDGRSDTDSSFVLPFLLGVSVGNITRLKGLER